MRSLMAALFGASFILWGSAAFAKHPQEDACDYGGRTAIERQEAIAACTKGINDPKVKEFEKVDLLRSRSDHYGWLRQYDAALADVNESLKECADKISRYVPLRCTHNRRALLHIEAGNYAKAISDYDFEIAQYVSSKRSVESQGQLHYYRGLVHEKNGDRTKAVTDFKKALELLPDKESLFDIVKTSRIVGALARLGVGKSAPTIDVDTCNMADLDMLEISIAACSRVIGKSSDESAITRAVAFRAFRYDSLRQFDKSLADWNTFLARCEKSDGADKCATSTRGVVYINLGKYKEAIADFTADEHRTMIEPQTIARSELFYYRGLAHEKIGEHAKAKADFEQALANVKPYSDGKLPQFGEVIRRRLGLN
jgi:tetratricopeptide (TPR) repeat protein